MQITTLLWDDWNTVHITHQQAAPTTVEEVIAGIHLSTSMHNQRIAIIGYPPGGRPLLITLALRGSDSFYVVTWTFAKSN